ncbi:MAG: pyridoxal phosphate-dependent aminotransferase, partial [Flavobacteriales bacterium]|nr:pyridoxal phosphate-dependent aminotransferase [Flavobacteriales bacterium]
LGEPDFDTPDIIKEAAKQAIDNNYSHYTPVNGLLEVREAISTKFKRDNQLDYSPDQIVISTGAKQSIANVIMSIVNPGDEVLLPAPYWVSYAEIVKMVGGVPVDITATLEQDFKTSAQQWENAITERTKLVIFSSPCNPSGTVYTKDEMTQFADILVNHPNLVVVCDEIYEHINFEESHYSLASDERVYSQVVTVNGVSKGFAMTGWRLGYIGAPLWIAKACTKIQGQITSGASAISQMAAKAAVEADPSSIAYMKEEFLKRRDYVLGRLRAMDGIDVNQPMGAFYVFANVKALLSSSYPGGTISSSDDLAMYFLNEAHVAVVAGSSFGTPDGIRLSYAASLEDLEKAMNRLETAIGQLTFN